MFRSPPSPLAAIAAACLLTIALPAGTAFAQKSKSKTKGETTQTTTDAGAPASGLVMPEVTVDIPEIVAADSNVDEDTLRDILSGDVVGNADALAGLTATSIEIPEVSVLIEATVDGETTESTFTITDIALSDVADGVATSITIGGLALDSNDEGSGSFGPMTASDFNIGALLGFYGLVETTGSREMVTIYSAFNFEGGSVTTPDGDCTMGAFTGAEVRARPLNFSMAEFFALAEELESAEDTTVPPELAGRGLRMYADLLTAVESDPVSFGGFDCTFVTDGEETTLAVGAGEMGGFTPGLYPAIAFNDIVVSVAGEGEVTLGNFTFKGMDLTGVIETLQSAPAAVDSSWFEANARKFMPAFEGLSIADLAVDLPDPETPGTRITGSLDSFDLTLSDYRNGIPADISTSLDSLVVDLPTDSTDETVQQLIAYGITTVDAGFNLDLAWDETEGTIEVADVSVTAANLATIALAGTITNATEALFDLDPNAAMAAAMGLMVADLQLDVTDEGAAELVLTQVAAEQGTTAAELRTVFAGLAQGTIMGQLATAANAQQVAQAVSAFVQGTAKSLSIELTAKEQPGLGLADFTAAEADPTVLLDKVDISAEAN